MKNLVPKRYRTFVLLVRPSPGEMNTSRLTFRAVAHKYSGLRFVSLNQHLFDEIKTSTKFANHAREFSMNISKSSKKENITTMPSKEIILQRLRNASEDDRYLEEKLFPTILGHQNEEKTARGVVLLLELAMHDYRQKNIINLPKGAQMVSEMRMDQLKPKFLEALIEDPAILSEAQEILNFARS